MTHNIVYENTRLGPLINCSLQCVLYMNTLHTLRGRVQKVKAREK